jgi:hypothetical protein
VTDMKDDLPEKIAHLKRKPRQYDLADLFIVSFYNFFTFALGLGLGYILWGMQ